MSFGIKTQQGQALIAVLAFTLVLAVALVYLFNTSQLLSERAQAKVLADHAAYNTATKHAQLLNAHAYMNKAKIANQLAVAQSVSVASWAKHIESTPHSEAGRALPLIPYVGTYAYNALVQVGQGANVVAELQGGFVQANAVATSHILAQQTALNAQAVGVISKEHELTQKKSSIGNGFRSDLLIDPNANPFDFISHYGGKNSKNRQAELSRIKDTLLAARDPFTAVRRKKHTVGPFDPITRLRLEHRGGTELSQDMTQWKGLDTHSLHYRRLTWRGWRHTERTISYGTAVARATGGDADGSNRAGYSSAAGTNPRSTSRSRNFMPNWDSRRQGSMSGEYGVPSYWDLSAMQLKQDEPTQGFSVKISKSSNQLDTTSGNSNFKVGSAIDISSIHNMTAVSTAQVYFERPLHDRNGNQAFLNSGKFEKASLFNPYWQVRLVDNTASTMTQASIR